MGLSGLLSFREIYIVPLTKTADRTERLERLISGLVLLAIPASGLIVAFAPDLVSVLLERGRFDAAATELTAQTLRIAALMLVTSAMTNPLFRMFQICDRINYTHITYVVTACALAIFGYLFVVALGWGVRGVALMQLASAIVSLIVIVYLAARCGIVLHWSSIVTHMALAGFISIIAYTAAVTATLHIWNVWGRLIVGGPIYGAVVLSGFFLARGQLRGIVFGFARTET
jgi:putative peptidoglycan lipid II flippase